MGLPGAWGARLTGAGFGGCTVNLVPSEGAAQLLDAVDRDFYRSRVPPDALERHRFILSIGGGAQVALLGAAQSP